MRDLPCYATSLELEVSSPIDIGKNSEDEPAVFLGVEIGGCCDLIEDVSGGASLPKPIEDSSTCLHESWGFEIHLKGVWSSRSFIRHLRDSSLYALIQCGAGSIRRQPLRPNFLERPQVELESGFELGVVCSKPDWRTHERVH